MEDLTVVNGVECQTPGLGGLCGVSLGEPLRYQKQFSQPEWLVLAPWHCDGCFITPGKKTQLISVSISHFVGPNLAEPGLGCAQRVSAARVLLGAGSLGARACAPGSWGQTPQAGVFGS